RPPTLIAKPPFDERFASTAMNSANSGRVTCDDRAGLEPSNVAPSKRGIASSDIPQKRPEGETQACEYRVTFDCSYPLPIADRELRAIETLLGAELVHLLRNVAMEH